MLLKSILCVLRLMVACKILMLSDFYMYYVCVTLYVIQLLAAKYGNKIYLSIQKKNKKNTCIYSQLFAESLQC